MIRFKVGLVLMLTDGFTGLDPAGAGMIFFLDGVQYAPQTKPGGYYVFLDIPFGKHILKIVSFKYEPVELEVESGYDTVPVILKPGKKYPFPLNAIRLAVDTTGKETSGLWVGLEKIHAQIRISQSDLKAGARELKLFFQDGAKRIRLPGPVLIADGENTEICVPDKLVEDDFSFLSEPLKYDHKRGCNLYPAQFYPVGEDGRIHIAYQNAGSVYLWSEGMKEPVKVEAGTSEFSLQ